MRVHPRILGYRPGMATTPRPQTAPAPAATPAVPATPLEDTNPPGTPEGTDPQSTGDLAEHPTTPLGTPGAVQPQGSDLHPDNSTEEHPDGVPYGIATHPVDLLAVYLATHHPADVQPEEHPATTAVRLLTRLGAAGDVGARCQSAYCNLPAGHHGVHGWVHVEPPSYR